MSASNKGNFLSAQTKNTAATPPSQVYTRTLCVHIEGSLNDMAHRGPLAGLWKGINGRENVLFHPNPKETLNSEASNSIINSLRNCVIKKVILKEHKSTFPILLGVDISCVPPNEVNNIGEPWAYTVLPQSIINAPQTIFQCDANTLDNTTWHQLYSQWNSSNLETHGTMDVPNQPFLFVHMDHPVIGLLRYNQNLIGCDIDAQPKLEQEYLKVSRQVMATCCQTIRDEVLNRLPTCDLNSCTIQLRRPYNVPWDEVDNNTLLNYQINPNLSEEEQQKLQEQHIKNYMTTPYQYFARIEIEYEMHPLNELK